MALGVIAVSAIFFAIVFTGIPATKKLQGNQLRDWPNARIRTELGEASQVVDCSQIGLPQGLTCRIWVSQAKRRIIILAS